MSILVGGCPGSARTPPGQQQAMKYPAECTLPDASDCRPHAGTAACLPLAPRVVPPATPLNTSGDIGSTLHLPDTPNSAASATTVSSWSTVMVPAPRFRHIWMPRKSSGSPIFRISNMDPIVEIVQYTHTFGRAHRTIKPSNNQIKSKRALASYPKRFASRRLMLVFEPFTVATCTLVASINSETRRCHAPLCFRIPASRSYAAALSGNTNDDVMHVLQSHERARRISTFTKSTRAAASICTMTNSAGARSECYLIFFAPFAITSRHSLSVNDLSIQYSRASA
jgi:hypothetical protein